MTKRICAAIGLLLTVAVSGVIAQERITLTTPESLPSNERYRLERLTLTLNDQDTPADEGHIHIQLMGVERKISRSCIYAATTTPTATTLLTAFQKANFSTAYAGNATTGSLAQRIFHRLVVMNEATAVCDRALVGSLTGSPQ